MSMDATLSYKNDDGELIGVAVRGIIHAVPEALENLNYNEKVEFVHTAAERGGFKVSSSPQLEFYINDDDFDPEWDSFTKAEFIHTAAKRGGFKVSSSLQLEFYIKDEEFDPEWDSFAPLDIFGVVAHRADINFFITDAGKIVEYDPRSVVRVDTALL